MAKKKKKKSTVKSSGFSQKKSMLYKTSASKQTIKENTYNRREQQQRFSFHQEVEIKGIRSDNAELFFLFLPSSKREVNCVCHLGQIALLFVCYCPSTARAVLRDQWTQTIDCVATQTRWKNTLPDFFFSQGKHWFAKALKQFWFLGEKRLQTMEWNTVVSLFQCQPGCFLHFQVTYYSNCSNFLKQWVGSQGVHRWLDSLGAHLVWAVSHRDAPKLCFSMVAHTWPLNCVDCTQ